MVASAGGEVEYRTDSTLPPDLSGGAAVKGVRAVKVAIPVRCVAHPPYSAATATAAAAVTVPRSSSGPPIHPRADPHRPQPCKTASSQMRRPRNTPSYKAHGSTRMKSRRRRRERQLPPVWHDADTHPAARNAAATTPSNSIEQKTNATPPRPPPLAADAATVAAAAAAAAAIAATAAAAAAAGALKEHPPPAGAAPAATMGVLRSAGGEAGARGAATPALSRDTRRRGVIEHPTRADRYGWLIEHPPCTGRHR